MIVNFTLIMQMVHFTVAYYLIDRILMRKVVASIKQDQRKDEQIQAGIDQELVQVSLLEAQKNESWQKIRILIKKNAPKEETLLVHKSTESMLKIEPTIESAHIKKYHDEISQFIVQKVSRVNS